MDSHVVSRSIKRLIQPMLKQAGFSVFSTRSAWRHSSDRIEVVNFRAVGSWFGSVSGCTTFAFTINLGCHLHGIPAAGKVKQKNRLSIPEEFQCFYRRQLRKASPQPGLSRAPDRDDVWFVDPLGNNLNALLEEARAALEQQGLPWFRDLPGLGGTLDILLDKRIAPEGTWGQWGKISSPARNRLIGYVALASGKSELAAKHLQQAIESPVYSSNETLATALKQARSGR